MSLLDGLLITAADHHPDNFKHFCKNIPEEWVQQTLATTGTATVRRRRLPAEQVVWLVIGMALLRDRPIDDVVASLDLVLDPQRGPLAGGTVPQARSKLGEEPMQRLFDMTAAAWADESSDVYRWRGLRVYGIDGTTMRVADSAENREHFGSASAGDRGESGYPLVRVAALMVLRSHMVAAISFGPYAEPEIKHAELIVGRVPDNALVVVDRGFLSAAFLIGIERAGANRHWLTRAKSNTKYEVVKALGDGDALVELQVSKEARRKEPSLPEVMQVRAVSYQRPGHPRQTLLTSLTDSRKYPAAEVVLLYHERWELELGYGEVKTDMLERLECIRSKSPAMVRQELWGIFLAYNMVRLEMDRVARELKLWPTKISFVASLRLIRDEWLWSAIASRPGSIPGHLQALRVNLSRLVLPPRRRERICPRAVKIKMSNYSRKRPGAAAR
jgi:hypothetical protein